MNLLLSAHRMPSLHDRAAADTGRSHGFDHARMPVYARALQLAVLSDTLTRRIRARPDLVDQMRRAAASVVLNIAEGAAEFRPREKIRFYRMARRSAAEVAAVLDLIVALGLVQERATEAARVEATTIGAALTGLIRSLERAAKA